MSDDPYEDLDLDEFEDGLTYRLTRKGHNHAHADAAHFHNHQSCPGPSSPCRPYLPPYRAGPDVLALPGSLPLAKAGPDWLAPIIPADEVARLEPRDEVLPLPIVDIIVSTSGLAKWTNKTFERGKPSWYYDSPLRSRWATHALDEAEELVRSRLLNDAARRTAEVFGALLPGFAMGCHGASEKEVFDRSWAMLRQLADPAFLMEALVRAFRESYCFGSLRGKRDAVAKAYGPSELRAAEALREAEERLLETYGNLDGKGIPAELPSWVDFVRMGTGTYRFRAVGPVVCVPSFYISADGDAVESKHPGLARRACWVADRGDGRVKVLELHRRVWLAMEAMGEQHLDDKGLEWTVEADKDHGRLKVVSVRHSDAPSPKGLPAGLDPASLTDDLVRMCYSPRKDILARLARLKDDRDRLLREFEKLHEGVAERVQRERYEEAVAIDKERSRTPTWSDRWDPYAPRDTD